MASIPVMATDRAVSRGDWPGGVGAFFCAHHPTGVEMVGTKNVCPPYPATRLFQSPGIVRAFEVFSQSVAFPCPPVALSSVLRRMHGINRDGTRVCEQIVFIVICVPFGAEPHLALFLFGARGWSDERTIDTMRHCLPGDNVLAGRLLLPETDDCERRSL